MNCFQSLKIFLGVIILVASGCATSSDHHSQIRNPPPAIPAPGKNAADNLMSVLWVQRSAEYRALCYQAFNTATEKLATVVSMHADPSALCIVLDIDETVLDNSVFQARLVRDDAEYSKAGWSNWTASASATAVPGALEFLKEAEKLGVEIFYISNRESVELAPTQKNLRALGFPSSDAAHIKLRSSREDTKQKRRLGINKEIILLVGDNLADFEHVFEGGTIDTRSTAATKFRHQFGRRFIVLPNPMYGDWETVLYSPDRQPTANQKAARRRELLKVK